MSILERQEIDSLGFFSEIATRGLEFQEQLLELAAAPLEKKTLNPYGIEKTAKLARTSTSTIRRFEAKGDLPVPKRDELNRRIYTLEDVNLIRARVGTDFRRPEGSLPARVLVANLKGGAGKTTTAVHLAQYLALQGAKTLLIDLDPQASATGCFGLVPDVHVDPSQTLEGPLIEDDRDLAQELARKNILPTYWHRLDLIASQLNMVSVDGELMQKDKDRVYRLRQLLDELEKDYDIIVIDVPPALGLLSINAMVAADYVVTPIIPSMLDISSSIQYFAILRTVAPLLRIAELSILINRHDSTPQADRAAAMIRAIYGLQVLNNHMPQTRELQKGAHEMLSLYEINRPTGSRETYRRAINAANAVNAEILSHIHQIWEDQVDQGSSVVGGET